MMVNEPLFWYYMVERESIRQRRAMGKPQHEWTEDRIFCEYSFTNVKRRDDRTTVLLNREFYAPRAAELSHPSPVALLNASVFRWHGTAEAARLIGWHEDWSDSAGTTMRDRVSVAQSLGEPVFTGAYMIPNGGVHDPKPEVVRVVINQIWNCARFVLDTSSWETACTRLVESCWNVGWFMAKEILLDYILATGWVPDDWQTWTPVGPGARRGAAVVRYDYITPGLNKSETLEVCQELFSRWREHWPLGWVDLDLTDVQFALCEVAKYRKVQTGEGRPRKRFRPTQDDVTLEIQP